MAKVFISYSHQDEKWKNRVVEHLGVLADQGLESWDDRRIAGGDDWLPEIEQAIMGCDLALLLISTKFLNSRFCVRDEVPVLLKRRAAEGIRVIPLILSDCAWDRLPWLSRIQARPTDGKPLCGMTKAKAEAALAKLARELHDHIQAKGAAPGIAELRSATGLPTVPSPFIVASADTGPSTARRSEIPADLSRIDKYAPKDLIGREAELQLLDDAWAKAQTQQPKRPHIITFVALGGEGKTSLVAHWAAAMAHNDWPGCEAAFAWSFYSQGSSDQSAASSDPFLRTALAFFGDESAAASAQGAYTKGQRLAQLVGGRRALLILDGLEPLQYPPASPLAGQLRDQGLTALLKGLAEHNRGLCLVTTRYTIPDLNRHLGKGVHEYPLHRLARPAGVALLQRLGVKGSLRRTIPWTGPNGPERLNEYEALVEEVQGHALTLHILGGFLARAFGGDIRRRDRVGLARADERVQGGHAFRAMAAYARWLEDGSTEAQRELAILRLLGLFDRPADAGCLRALLQPPVIPGLTEPLQGLPEEEWGLALDGLRQAGLVNLHRDGGQRLIALDAHPLVREWFAQQLQREPETWRAAHRRLYEHLCAAAPACTRVGKQDPKTGWFPPLGAARPPSLDDLQPLYQAVTHGCQAGLQQAACDKVYYARIQRGAEAYSMNKLGALGSDLGAIASLFETPWGRPSPALSEDRQAWLLNEAAFRLRALGRLTEALEPLRAGVEMLVKQEDWKNAAISAGNLSELELTLGELGSGAGGVEGTGPAGALADAARAVEYADLSGDWVERMFQRTTLADALHQAGLPDEAEALFREAEGGLAEIQPQCPLLYSVQGFQYCDLLLTGAERAAWRVNRSSLEDLSGLGTAGREGIGPQAEWIGACRAVVGRATRMLQWAEQSQQSLVDIALAHLTLGRAALYAGLPLDGEATAPGDGLSTAATHLDLAVDGLRRAGAQNHLPRALLTRAWLRALQGRSAAPAQPPAPDPIPPPPAAEADLNEAQEIAERGPMPLFLADCHLHRARLFRDALPDRGAELLRQARALIERHGYGRRLGELEDACKILLGEIPPGSQAELWERGRP